MACSGNPNTLELLAEGSELQGQTQLHSEVKKSLSYMRPFINKQTNLPCFPETSPAVSSDSLKGLSKSISDYFPNYAIYYSQSPSYGLTPPSLSLHCLTPCVFTHSKHLFPTLRDTVILKRPYPKLFTSAPSSLRSTEIVQLCSRPCNF